MAKINVTGYFSTLASSLIHFCLVIVAVGPVRHTTADDVVGPMMSNITGGFVGATSPMWIDGLDSVYFMDSGTNRLVRYQILEGATTSVELDAFKSIKFMVPVQSDVQTKFVAGFGGGVGVYTWDGSSTEKLLKESELTVSEDRTQLMQCGSGDVGGRFWMGASYTVGGPFPKTFGHLYSVDKNGNGILRLDRIGVPGGITWSPDHKIIYYSDTTANTIVSHSFDKDTGDIQNDSRVVFDFKAKGIKGSPGGITIDTGGNLWVACVTHPYVIQIEPKADGRLLQKIDLPTIASSSSVAFGTSDKKDLYVTTSDQLFLVTHTGSEGIPVYRINIDNWLVPNP